MVDEYYWFATENSRFLNCAQLRQMATQKRIMHIFIFFKHKWIRLTDNTKPRIDSQSLKRPDKCVTSEPDDAHL